MIPAPADAVVACATCGHYFDPRLATLERVQAKACAYCYADTLQTIAEPDAAARWHSLTLVRHARLRQIAAAIDAGA